MSYDLDVVSHLRPTDQDVRDILAKDSRTALDGSMAPGTGGMTVRTAGRNPRPLCLVGPPDPVVPEELPDGVASAVLSPQWTTEITVPAIGGDQGVRVARRLAKGLAKACQGVVVDQQEGTVLVGSKTKPMYKDTGEPETPVTVARVVWLFALERMTASHARHFLQIVKRTIPQAMPVRYGELLEYPYRRRFRDEDAAEFCAYWEQGGGGTDRGAWGWRGSYPCFEGEVRFLRHPPPLLPDQRPAYRVSLEFDARPLLEESRWREAVVDLFSKVAEEQAAFYGAIYLTRGFVVRGRELVELLTGERLTVPVWNGLPAFRTWVTWFGTPYRDLVRSSLIDLPVEARGGGLFLRLSETPLNADELKGRFPAFPESLTQRSGFTVRDELLGGKNTTSVRFTNEIAREIPALS